MRPTLSSDVPVNQSKVFDLKAVALGRLILVVFSSSRDGAGQSGAGRSGTGRNRTERDGVERDGTGRSGTEWN